MKSNNIKQLEAWRDQLTELNRPERRINTVRSAIRSVIHYEQLIKKYANKPELCQLYAEKIREIVEAIRDTVLHIKQ